MDGNGGAPRRSKRLADKAAQRSACNEDEACGSVTVPSVHTAPRYRSVKAPKRVDHDQQEYQASPVKAAPRTRKRAMAGAGMGRRTIPPPAKRARAEPLLSGYWDVLPLELVDNIIERCAARQLAALETTCRYFVTKVSVETVCEKRLRAVSRAKGLEPDRRAGEKWSSLLHFISAQSAAAAQATALSLGGFHSSALLVEVPADSERNFHAHSLYTWGRGWHGQLGHNDHEDQATPKLLCLGYCPMTDKPEVEEEITAAVVSCGTDHTATISRRGQLFTWGLGNSGELGHNDTTFLDTPFPLRAYLYKHDHVRVVSVACGGNHTLAIAENGTLWACGRNKSGQLGNGTTNDTSALGRVVNLPKTARIVSAGAGALHSMALASDGSLFTWGDARYGQLGHAHLQQPLLPNHNPIQRWPLKIGSLHPQNLLPFNRITAISCGKWHGMAVTVGGGLLAFGRNSHGQLGTGDRCNRWTPTHVQLAWNHADSRQFRSAQVACGAMHSLVLVAHQGRLTACSTGYNYFGQLGLGHTREVVTLQPVHSIRDPVALVAGDHNSGCIAGDGRVLLWGRNDRCQLGLGDDCTHSLPAALPGLRAVHPDRTLRKSKRSAPRTRRVQAPAPSKEAGREESRPPLVTPFTRLRPAKPQRAASQDASPQHPPSPQQPASPPSVMQQHQPAQRAPLPFDA